MRQNSDFSVTQYIAIGLLQLIFPQLRSKFEPLPKNTVRLSQVLMGKVQYSDSDLSTSREVSFDQSMSRNDNKIFGNIAQKYPILLTYPLYISITHCDRIDHTFAQLKHGL